MTEILPTNEVWTRYRETGDAGARNEIIMRYRPLVKSVLNQMNVPFQCGLDSEDMLSHGTMGLIEAIQRFDPSCGVKFESYAIPRIRGSILDMVRNLEPRSRGCLRTTREIEVARGQLIHELLREPTDQELAAHVGISARRFKRNILEGNWRVVSIDHHVRVRDDVENLTLADVIKDEHCLSPETVAENEELMGAVRRAVQYLPKRLRLVLVLRYYNELTVRDVASALGISESRVSQLHRMAVLRLRNRLRGNGAIPTGIPEHQKRRLEVA